MIARALAGAVLISLAAPAAAHAATRPIQAVDDPATFQKYWTPKDLAAQQGDTIQWRLTEPGNASAASHDIWLIPPGGTQQDAVQLGTTATTPTVTASVDQLGTYQFYCSIHGGLAPGGMNGTIAVGAADPGPPVDPGTPWTTPGGGGTGGGGGGAGTPSGPAPLLNPMSAPSVLEWGDNRRPVLRVARVWAVRRGVRARVRLSEPATLTIRVRRGAKAVESRRVRLRAGTRTVTVRGLRPGRYGVWLQATDRAQLQSRASRARVRVRPRPAARRPG